MSRDGDHSKDTVKTSEHPRASLKPPRRGAEVGGFFVQTDMCACSFVRQLAPRLKSWQCSENLVDRISASVNTTRDQSRTTQNQRSHIFFFFLWTQFVYLYGHTFPISPLYRGCQR